MTIRAAATKRTIIGIGKIILSNMSNSVNWFTLIATAINTIEIAVKAICRQDRRCAISAPARKYG